MSNSVTQQQMQQQVEEVSIREIEEVAEAILKSLDEAGDIGVEKRDPFSGGPIRVHRDQDGRVYIRTPRSKISTRLEVRKTRMCWRENKISLAAFLDRERIALSFLRRVF